MPRRKHPQTGPKTPPSKDNSSPNRVEHGMHSKRLILPDESAEDYAWTRSGWLGQFTPETFVEERLVEQLILNDWLMQRANRWLVELQGKVAERQADPGEWSAEQEHKLEVANRQRSTAERAFYRALHAAQRVRRDLKHIQRPEKQNPEETSAKGAGPVKNAGGTKKEPAGRPGSLFQGQRAQTKRKKEERPQVLDQWVEIEITPKGKAVTTLYPPNPLLLREGQAMWPPPDLVYRRLHFVDGVPPEYAWVGASETVRARGGLGIQRMPADRWVELAGQEEASGTGHVGPCGGNLPRPEERGGCECRVCVANREVLEAMAEE